MWLTKLYHTLHTDLNLHSLSTCLHKLGEAAARP
jgi:hypothetical protein|eukprot:COSAG06_NODE_290_length_18223_cov_5.866696_7_plen_34_part_00